MKQLPRAAWLVIVIADAGLLAWGVMAALAPEHLLGPGFAPILTAGYESFTKSSWSELTGTSPKTTAFMTVLFRVYGAYVVAFGLLAVAKSPNATLYAPYTRKSTVMNSAVFGDVAASSDHECLVKPS